MSKWVVITSINEPKDRYREYINLGWNVVVVGDLKSDENNAGKFASLGLHYLSFRIQEEMFPRLSNLIGPNTYARKNLGYLYALAQGAQKIYETDDDTFLRFPSEEPLAKISTMNKLLVTGKDEFFNPFSYFAPEHEMWPRGYPLRLVKSGSSELIASSMEVSEESKKCEEKDAERKIEKSGGGGN